MTLPVAPSHATNPEDRFLCGPYKAVLSGRACVLRSRATVVPRPGGAPQSAYSDCVGCGVGQQHERAFGQLVSAGELTRKRVRAAPKDERVESDQAVEADERKVGPVSERTRAARAQDKETRTTRRIVPDPCKHCGRARIYTPQKIVPIELAQWCSACRAKAGKNSSEYPPWVVSEGLADVLEKAKKLRQAEAVLRFTAAPAPVSQAARKAVHSVKRMVPKASAPVGVLTPPAPAALPPPKAKDPAVVPPPSKFKWPASATTREYPPRWEEFEGRMESARVKETARKKVLACFGDMTRAEILDVLADVTVCVLDLE